MMRSLYNIMCLLIALPIICANHPISLTTSEMQFASVNDSVTLWCSLSHKHHLSKDVKIEWFDGPLPIKTAFNGITIKHNKTKAKLESQMIINKVENFHFGQYNCKSTDNKGELLVANTSLLPRGTNDNGKNLITNINLTHAGQVPLKCNNIPPENNVSWKKVQLNQTVVSLDVKADSFNDTISSLAETGKFICYDNSTVFHISYVYPQDYNPLRFTENLPNNATLVYNDTNSILLTCTVPSLTKHTKLDWIFNDKILTSDVVKRIHVPAVTHTDSGYQLQLIITSPIPKMDTGTYTCVAENEWEKIERHFNVQFKIKNADPFTITSFASQEEYMIDGTSFTASCVIRLNKGIEPKVLMLYSNALSNYPTLLVEDTNTYVQHTTDTTNHVKMATVNIKNASVENNGTYYCIVLNFDGDPLVQKMTTQFKKRPVEIIKYYKDPIEKHSITCKAHIFAMSSITIKFTHHTNHGHNDMYDPTSTFINTTDKSITAHLDLNSIHNHHRYHGVYVCTTSASLLDRPDKIYNDSRDLTVEQTTKKHTASVMEFSVQSSETDQSSNDTPTTETVYIVVGVTVVMVATAVLVFIVVHQRLRRSKHSLLNQSHYV